MAFSPDGALLASGSSDGSIVLWDVASGAEVRVLAGHSTAPSLLAFSPDGKTVAAGGADGAVRLWDVAAGQPEKPRGGHQGAVRAVAFSPDGQLLASAGEDRTVRVCDAAAGERLRMFRAPAAFLSLAFSPDGKLVAAGTRAPDRAVHVWDLKTGKGQSQPAGGDVAGLAFHPGGRVLAVATGNGTVRLSVDGPGNGRTLVLGPGPFGTEITGLAFSPEGGCLAVPQGNGLISILRVPQPPEDYRPGPATVPDPATLARRPSAADALKRADLPRGALPELAALLGEELRFRLPTSGVCHNMAVSKGGEHLAVPCGNDLAIFDARTGKLLHVLPEHKSRALEAAFSPDGKRVACGSCNHSVRVWDVEEWPSGTDPEGAQQLGPRDRLQPRWEAAGGCLLGLDRVAVGRRHRRKPSHPEGARATCALRLFQPGRQVAAQRQPRSKSPGVGGSHGQTTFHADGTHRRGAMCGCQPGRQVGGRRQRQGGHPLERHALQGPSSAVDRGRLAGVHPGQQHPVYGTGEEPEGEESHGQPP